MKGNYRSLLRKFCLDGSVSGLKYFYLYPDKASRCFWGIFVVTILFFAWFLGYLLYRRFEAMPTRITIENQFEPIESLPYPAITLCSPNQITISAVDHLNHTLVNGNRSLDSDLQLALRQILGFYHFVKLDPDTLSHLQDLIVQNRYTVPEVLVLLSQGCEQYLKLCVFRRRVRARCRGLFRPLLTAHGLCCIFNSMYYFKNNRRNERDPTFKPHLVQKSGLTSGLTVILDFDPEDAVDRTIHFAGATRVMITDWTEFPADDESLLVGPDTESFHIMHATATYCSDDVKELPQSSRKCSFEDETRLPFFMHYRNSDCDLLCLVHIVERQCGCQLFYLPQLRLQQVCGFHDIVCIFDARLNLNKWLEKEQCACPRDCDSRRYRVDVTTGNLHSLQYLTKHIPLKVNKSTSIMHFFFPTPVFEKQKQETVMSITTLASNLGGVFGLCLGCSVVSVLEILFYHYAAARGCVRRRVRRRRRCQRRGGQFYYE